MSEQLTFNRDRRIWRIQGDITDGDLSSLTLEVFWEEVWITPSGEVVNTVKAAEPVRLSIATTDESTQQYFQTIRDQLASLISEATLSPTSGQL